MAMDEEKNVGLSDYVAALKRRRRLIASIALPIAALGVVVALGLPSKYVSQGVVQVEEAKIAGYLTTTQGGGRSYVDQYVSSLTDRVMDDEKLRQLASQNNFYPKLKGDVGATVAKLRKDMKLQMVTSRILDPESGREREVISAFKVSYENGDAKLAQLGAAWLAQGYLDANRENHRQKSAGASGFLATEASRYRDRIADAEKKLSEFKQKNVGRLPELTNVNMNMLDNTQRDLESTNTQIQTLQRDRVFVLQQLNQAQLTSPEAERIPQLEAEYRDKSQIYDENHPDLVSLRKQIEMLKSSGAGGMSLQSQLDAQRQALAQALTRYSPDHPDVKAVQRRIKTLEARIASGEKVETAVSRSPVAVQLQTQLSAIDTQIAGLQARVLELRAKASTFENRITSTPEVEREYQTLSRDLELARAKYDELLKQQMDAEVTTQAIAGGAADEFRLVEAPTIPGSPAKPLRTALALVGLIAALIIGVGAAILAEMFDSTVRGSRDLRAIFATQPLAVVPAIYSDSARRRRNFQAMAYGLSIGAVSLLLFAALRIL